MNKKYFLCKSLLTIMLSSLLIIILLEIGIRFTKPQPIGYYNFTSIYRPGWDALITEQERPDAEAFPIGPYIPGLKTKQGGVNIEINSLGWRDHEYLVKKPQGSIRVIVVGDSVTYGHGVILNEVFHKVAERQLENRYLGKKLIEVWGIGIAGGDTRGEKYIIKKSVFKYNPDLIVLAFNLNDINREANIDFVAKDRRNYIGSMIDVLRKIDTFMYSRYHLYYISRDSIRNIMRKTGITKGGYLKAKPELDWEGNESIILWKNTSKDITEIRNYLSERRIHFAVLILPMDMQVSKENAKFYREKVGIMVSKSLEDGVPQKIIKDFLNTEGIQFIDPLPAFKSDGFAQKFLRKIGDNADYNHPNAKGHMILGEALKNYILHWVNSKKILIAKSK